MCGGGGGQYLKLSRCGHFLLRLHLPGLDFRLLFRVMEVGRPLAPMCPKGQHDVRGIPANQSCPTPA